MLIKTRAAVLRAAALFVFVQNLFAGDAPKYYDIKVEWEAARNVSRQELEVQMNISPDEWTTVKKTALKKNVNVFTLNLLTGFYRYRVRTFNVLGQSAPLPNWTYFNVLAKAEPSSDAAAPALSVARNTAAALNDGASVPAAPASALPAAPAKSGGFSVSAALNYDGAFVLPDGEFAESRSFLGGGASVLFLFLRLKRFDFGLGYTFLIESFSNPDSTDKTALGFDVITQCLFAAAQFNINDVFALRLSAGGGTGMRYNINIRFAGGEDAPADAGEIYPAFSAALSLLCFPFAKKLKTVNPFIEAGVIYRRDFSAYETLHNANCTGVRVSAGARVGG